MGFMKVAKLFLSITVVFSFFMFILASAAVYKIGDDAGWTFGSANVNYGVWAATKKFQIDDILGKSALFITLFFLILDINFMPVSF